MLNHPAEMTPQDEAALAAFMTRLAETPSGPGLTARREKIWLQMRLAERRDIQRKVTMPLDIAEPVGILGALVTAALLLLWLLPSISHVLMSL